MNLRDPSHQTTLEFRWTWVGFGILVGLCSGGVAVAYRFVLSIIDEWRTEFVAGAATPASVLGLIGILCLCALGMHLLLTWAPHSGGSGIPQTRAELGGVIDAEMAPTMLSKFAGGSLGNIAGLTLGREGPSIQLGAMVAKGISRRFHIPEAHQRVLLLAGASAGLSAAFNAPLSATLFALEEMTKSFAFPLVLTALIAALVANILSFAFMGVAPAFSFALVSPLSLSAWGDVVLIGIAGGLCGVVFNRGLLYTQNAMKRFRLPRWALLFVVMLLLLAIGRIQPLFLGGGHALVETLAQEGFTEMFARAGAFPLLLLALRFLFIWLCYGTGAQGGIFLPVLSLGAILGLILYPALGGGVENQAVNFIYLGMVAVLTAVVQSPIMCILLVTEMSGSITALWALASCALVAWVVANVMRTAPVYDLLYVARYGEAPDHGLTAHKDSPSL